MELPDLSTAMREGGLDRLPPESFAAEHLTARNAAGNTPLHLAAKHGRLRELPAHALTAEYLSVRNDAG
jgi:ankyrin repeat protein